MIAVRALAFLLFLALSLALGAWQVLNIRTDFDAAPKEGAAFAILLLALGLPLAEIALHRLAPARARRPLLVLAGLPALPLAGLFGGLVSLVQARGGDHRRVWDAALLVGALLSINGLVPLVVSGLMVGGGPGLALGWMAIKLQFFVAIDYFLARALVHYFNSGAGTFVSLRYLRKRVISLLSVFGIGAGVMVLILVNSVMTGFQIDFKEQVRGSLSHLLVRFDGDRLHATMDDDALAQAEWSEYVRRIESRPELQQQWQAVLDGALKRLRDSDGDGLADALDHLRAQPADDPPPGPGLTERQRRFLERARTGRGLTDLERESLRDGLEVTTPRRFYLARVTDAAAEEEQARRAWYTPLFRQRLQQQFDRAAQALQQHRAPDGQPDVLGVSWRVGTKTFITPRTASRELSLADLVGVDSRREPEISDLGRYVAAAEIQVFKDQHVLKPLLNMLGATLGWETEQSLEAQGVKDPVFMFTPDGKDMGRMPADMKQLLGRRGFVTGTGNVRWANFDQVRFAAWSPGARLYQRLKEAHKDATRTDDIDALRAILRACHADVGAILVREMEKPQSEEASLAAARMGSRIIYNDFFTGNATVDRAIRLRRSDVQVELSGYLAEGGGPKDAAERAALETLRGQIDAATALADKAAGEGAESDTAREKALSAMLATYGRLLETAAARAAAADWPSAELLRQLAALQPDPQTGLILGNALVARQPVPLTYAVEQFDAGADFARRRIQAYSEVLPLRTTMRPDDTPESYRARALETGRRPSDGVSEQGSEPGLILGDALAESAILGGVGVGDVVEITIPRVYFVNGRPDSKASQVKFRITALFRSGLYEDNLGRMYCDFDELAAILADSEVRYYVGARLRDYSLYEGALQADRLKGDVRQSLHQARVLFSGVTLWEDEKRSLLEAVEREKLILGLIVSFIIVLVGFVILMLVYQLVKEKQKDIGILKALGFSPWGIRSVFMFNALFIGVFGAALGGLAGMVSSEYLNEIEDFIDRMTGIRLFPPDVYFLTYIPSVKGLQLLRLALDIAAPVVLFSFGCGILPAQLAARKDPVEALHYE